MELTIPYKYDPRYYQIPFFRAIDTGTLRCIIIWPRRHGKDKSCFNALVKKMLERVGVYYYVFPEYNQGRKALWDNIDKSGFKTIHHVPQELIKRKDNTQMLIELVNGSIVQVIGASEIDRIVGTNPVGIVLSEYSLMSPNVIGFLMPILAENGGFLWVNFTPRGNNHAKKLYDSAIKNPLWFVQRLNAKECGVFTAEQLEEIRQEYINIYGDDALFNQEFMVSFDSPVQGSYYGVHMQRAMDEGRIANIPYEENVLVNTYWDLGVGDSTAIWFEQTVGKEVRIIDYYENSGEGLAHYIKTLKEKPYVYGQHWAPHDIKVREFSTGKSRFEKAQKLGITFNIVPKLSLEDGIEAVRTILGKCWFDRTKTEKGVDGLWEYHKAFDEDRKVFRDKPEHNWASHPADGFRYLAIAHSENNDKEEFPEDDLWDANGYFR